MKGWKHREITHKDYAEIVARRLCVFIEAAENALKTLSDNPVEAFRQLANMGETKAVEYILKEVEI